MASKTEEVVLVRNPSYSVAPSSISPPIQLQKRGRGSVIIFGDVQLEEPTATDVEVEAPEFEKMGSSSKWDHHITLAVVATLIAAICLNPLAIGCGVAAIYYSFVARVASRNDDYKQKIENERTSHAFFIVCVITLIITVCMVVFAAYEISCGRTGVNC